MYIQNNFIQKINHLTHSNGIDLKSYWVQLDTELERVLIIER